MASTLPGSIQLPNAAPALGGRCQRRPWMCLLAFLPVLVLSPVLYTVAQSIAQEERNAAWTQMSAKTLIAAPQIAGDRFANSDPVFLKDSSVVYAVLDAENRVLAISNNVKSIFGMDASGVYGKPVCEVFVGPSGNECQKLLETLHASRNACQLRPDPISLKTKDGVRRVWVILKEMTYDSGSKSFTVLVLGVM